MSAIRVETRHRLQPVLFIVGVILVGGAFVAILVDRSIVVVRGSRTVMQVLPESAYTGYAVEPPIDPNALSDTLLVVFACVAFLGIAAVVAAVSLRFAKARSVQTRAG